MDVEQAREDAVGLLSCSCFAAVATVAVLAADVAADAAPIADAVL